MPLEWVANIAAVPAKICKMLDLQNIATNQPTTPCTLVLAYSGRAGITDHALIFNPPLSLHLGAGPTHNVRDNREP